MLSEKGDYIYVLCNFEEDILKEEAERLEFEMQMEVGSSDLLSLEPCDKKWRPYRFVKEGKPRDIKLLEEELQEFYIILYQDEINSLTSQPIHEQAEISDEEWKAYRCFLTFLQTSKQDFLKLIFLNKEIKGLLFREIFQQGYRHVLQECNFKLMNIWNFFNVPKPVGAYTEYYRHINHTTGRDQIDCN